MTDHDDHDCESVLETRAEMERDYLADEDVTFPSDPTPATPLSDWDW